nr:MAG TPA: hypothetical protein [Caudoviricetes sp.]
MIAWKQSDKHIYKELTKGTAFIPSPFHIPIDTPHKKAKQKAKQRAANKCLSYFTAPLPPPPRYEPPYKRRS